MSELLREQMSALCDDALSSEESALLVRRLEADTELTRAFACYQLIGASMRREPDASALAARVRAALGNERLPPVRREVPWRLLAKSAGGLAVAASVAVVALSGLRMYDTRFATPVVADTTVRNVEPPTYVVPETTSESSQVAGRAKLVSYFMRHGDYATMPNPPIMNYRGVGVGQHSSAAQEPEIEQPDAERPETQEQK